MGWDLSSFQISRDNAAMVGTLRMQLRPRPEDIVKLKAPLGELLTGKPEEAVPKLLRLVEREKPPKVVTVGDVVSMETWRAGLRADLRIIDQKSMRKAFKTKNFLATVTLRTENPAGVIAMEAWQTIRQAMNKREAIILVEGEEDLLALPAIAESPDDTFVVYGQPREGIVVVRANPTKKAEILTLLNSMTGERA